MIASKILFIIDWPEPCITHLLPTFFVCLFVFNTLGFRVQPSNATILRSTNHTFNCSVEDNDVVDLFWRVDGVFSLFSSNNEVGFDRGLECVYRPDGGGGKGSEPAWLTVEGWK